MAIKFIDLENAYATIRREMTMGTLGWIGVPEAGVGMVERAYEDTKGRELCGPGVSGESKVNVGLTQGSALIPLLFIVVSATVCNVMQSRTSFHVCTCAPNWRNLR